VWRRIRVVPFPVTIPADEQDGHLDERLQADADAVLTWAIEGYQQYVEIGLAEPDAVKVATSNYQKAMDAVARFIAECCLINPHMYATTSELFARWVTWAAEDGTEPISSKAFGQALDRKGYPAGPGGRAGRTRRGIGLQAEDDGDTE
jgi:putative DNA primase/helicase